MEIVLTPEIEEALKAQAQLQGVSPQELALMSLREKFVRTDDTNEQAGEHQTLLDFLDGYIGVIHSGDTMPDGADLSDDTGNTFTRLLVEKRKQGRL